MQHRWAAPRGAHPNQAGRRPGQTHAHEQYHVHTFAIFDHLQTARELVHRQHAALEKYFQKGH